MMDIARVTTRIEDGERWLGVEGELEIGSVPLLESAVDEALAAGGEDVVVDLAGVSFVDSTGLAGLLAASRRVGLADRRMRVHAPPGNEARVLMELSGTGSALGLFP